jgi:MFS family permease
MYTLIRGSLQQAGAQNKRPSKRRLTLPRVSRTVLSLGFTSLFTDISSESVNSVLPLYFLVALRFTPFGFGFIDGINQGAAALVSVFGGVLADRWRRPKIVAAAGYGLSAVARFLLLAAGGFWPAVTGAIGIDRIGKGVRTAPRDAMIARSSNPAALGTAFGVHRALDTLGALIGPILAFVILARTANAFDAVFVVSCCAAMIGLAVLFCFVPADRAARAPAPPAAERLSMRAVAGLVSAQRFRTLIMVSSLLSLATISDGFLYLVLQRGLHFSIGFFPLLYVGTSLSYFVLAVPAGWIADRLGTGRVFVGGYALLLLVYTALLHGSSNVLLIFGYLGVFGAYYAATDGVLRAHASIMLPAALRTSGLGLLTTATSVASLVSSVLFGALWTVWGPHVAVLCFFVALGGATALATFHLVIAAPRKQEGEAAYG